MHMKKDPVDPFESVVNIHFDPVLIGLYQFVNDLISQRAGIFYDLMAVCLCDFVIIPDHTG